jgi:hypothetical protein
MKRIIFIIKTALCTAVMLLAFNACTDDLNVIPGDKTIITPDEYLTQNPQGYREYLAKLYAGLAISGPSTDSPYDTDILGLDPGFGQYLRAYWMLQEVPTEEALLHWSDAGVPEISKATWAANNQFIRAMYLRLAYQAKVTSEYLLQTTEDKVNGRGQANLWNDIKRYRAEARFLRALSYVHAIDLFGNFAYIDETSPINVAPPQKSRTELFDYAESELLDIIPELAEPRTNEYGRIDKAAAWFLLAKLYLNAQVWKGAGANRYSDCITMCDNLINAGYSLGANYSHLFMADNDTNDGASEYIFLVPADGVHLQSYGSTTFIISAEVLSDYNAMADFGISGGWNGITTRPEFVNLYSAGDTRAMFFTSGHSLDITLFNTDTKQGYGITKYSNRTSTGGSGSNGTFADTDYPLFRLADVYLMYAEANLRGGGGDATKALGLVNQIRTRAGASTVGSLSIDFLLDERGRELYWEGWRRQDLIRFGKFTGGSYLWQWKGNSHYGNAIAATRALYPVPADQIGLNPNLTQNPGY